MKVGTLVQLRARIQLLNRRPEFYEMVLQIAIRFEAYLLDLNRIQLSRGEDIFGNVVGQYSRNTQNIAATENTRQPKIEGQNYNFEWSGELFDGMFMRLSGDTIEVFSTAPHTEEVIARYSGFFGDNTLLGFQDSSKIEFVREKLLPETRKWVCEILNL